MRIFLLRSAEANQSKKDTRRKLTSNGIESLAVLVDFLKKKELGDIQEIRHSPYVRTTQTAKRFKKLTGIKAKTRETPLLEPTADFRILADFIESSNETLLLVGHQAQLAHLGSYLLTRESDLAILDLKPGGMACLQANTSEEEHGASGLAWQLSWQIRPRML
ncbi:phosphohistidine phosphatase SixA [Opitutia bacterium ISCC 51]|nr:phosphohistidine phosphatase SixA [Opitutae bacterium ISCC 51]QXD28103.1 phosphohistidine phosphatase SixA [Opitutae bacterium ISCC 52]